MTLLIAQPWQVEGGGMGMDIDGIIRRAGVFCITLFDSRA
jgi:hypothetical protein